jgi:hypothetical protein
MVPQKIEKIEVLIMSNIFRHPPIQTLAKFKENAVDRCAIDESKCEISAYDFLRVEYGLYNGKTIRIYN